MWSDRHLIAGPLFKQTDNHVSYQHIFLYTFDSYLLVEFSIYAYVNVLLIVRGFGQLSVPPGGTVYTEDKARQNAQNKGPMVS
jgi:hypothetical protein